MSNVEIWTYICYGLAGIFLIAAMAFALMLYITSQNEKKNPIALPKAQKEEVAKKEIFEDDDSSALGGGLPGGRRRKGGAPIMHKPTKNLVGSSESFFGDDDEAFKLTGGQDK